MGGDGGSIPRRIELVRNKKKRQNAGKVAVNAAKWKHCALSQEPLRSPIVSCQLGRLYNKEAIIEKLLDHSKFTTSVADHIKKLKDVRILTLTPTPKESQSHELSSGIIENSAESFCCPVMGQEMNGLYPFVYSWECGCVVSKRAFDEVKDSNCLNCGKPLNPDSIILLNPEDDEDVKEAQERLKAYKQGTKKPRVKSMKSSKPELNEPVRISVTNGYLETEPQQTFKEEEPDVKRRKVDETTSSASAPRRTAPTGGGRRKRVEVAPSSLQDDPNASAVFKSLFTTSEEAKNQPKNHWVTFNPLYFR